MPSSEQARPGPGGTDKAPGVPRLWVSQSGHVLCDAHSGGYLAAAVARFPRRRRHHTPLDSWEAIEADEADHYHPEDLAALACEDRRCGARL